MPERIQLRRTKGWRLPTDTVVVARPSRWGNPFRLGSDTPDVVVAKYLFWLGDAAQAELREAIRAELRGHDLACWCSLERPCHADLLLKIANR